MKDLMVDIETFGNGKRACITQIGAVYFDRHTGELGKEFKVNIDARDAVKCGGELDADTVYWWLSQSREAIDSVTTGDLRPLREGLMGFLHFSMEAKQIWSHATFDFVILQESCKMLGLQMRYTKARDIRTLMDLSGISARDKKHVRQGTHHDALDDCKFQVKYCVDAFNSLNSKDQK